MKTHECVKDECSADELMFGTVPLGNGLPGCEFSICVCKTECSRKPCITLDVSLPGARHPLVGSDTVLHPSLIDPERRLLGECMTETWGETSWWHPDGARRAVPLRIREVQCETEEEAVHLLGDVLRIMLSLICAVKEKKL